jgi:hypothetical protein
MLGTEASRHDGVELGGSFSRARPLDERAFDDEPAGLRTPKFEQGEACGVAHARMDQTKALGNEPGALGGSEELRERTRGVRERGATSRSAKSARGRYYERGERACA